MLLWLIRSAQFHYINRDLSFHMEMVCRPIAPKYQWVKVRKAFVKTVILFWRPSMLSGIIGSIGSAEVQKP